MVLTVLFCTSSFSPSCEVLVTIESQTTLFFQSVSYPDEGFYSCIAGNTLGETVSSAYLEIAAATVDNLDTRIATLTLVLMVGYAKL